MSVSPVESGASKAIEEGAPFRLLDLPRELRDRVYHYAYLPSSPDIRFIERCERLNAQREAWRPAEPSKLLGPLHLVSHQMHDELEEYLARLPNETVTMRWMMCGGFWMAEWNAARFARCPKVTSLVFQVTNNQCEYPYVFAFCNELLAFIQLFRTGGTKVQTVTFYGSEWSGQFEWRNHDVLPEEVDIRVTVDVRTLKISELSGSLAPVLKMELIEGLEVFQGLLLVDEPHENASLWLSETELVQYEDERSQAYLSYLEWLCREKWNLEWLCNEKWKVDHSWVPFYWIVDFNQGFQEIYGSPPESPGSWSVEEDESPESLPAVPDGWALERSEAQESAPEAPE